MDLKPRHFNPAYLRSKTRPKYFSIWSMPLYFCGVALLFGVVSAFIDIEITSSARGRIVPQGKIHVLQAPFEGVITGLKAGDGQVVEAGAVLMQLDNSGATAELNKLKALAASCHARLVRTRYLIEHQGASSLPPDLFSGTADVEIARNEYALTEQSAAAYRAGVMGFETRQTQLKARIRASLAMQHSTRSMIQTLNEIIAADEKLKAIGFKAKTANFENELKLRDYQRTLSASAGELAVYQAELQTLDAERSKFIADWTYRLTSEQNQARTDCDSLQQNRTATEERLRQTVVRSPITGRLETLVNYGPGGSVLAGEPLFKVVPLGSRYVFEASIDNKDIGFLQKGQQAHIKVDAFPSVRYGTLLAHLEDLSADATSPIEVVRSKNQTLMKEPMPFIVRMLIEPKSGASKGLVLDLRSGMTGSADIVTGKRRLLSYLFDPLREVFSNSLSDR